MSGRYLHRSKFSNNLQTLLGGHLLQWTRPFRWRTMQKLPTRHLLDSNRSCTFLSMHQLLRGHLLPRKKNCLRHLSNWNLCRYATYEYSYVLHHLPDWTVPFRQRHFFHPSQPPQSMPLLSTRYAFHIHCKRMYNMCRWIIPRPTLFQEYFRVQNMPNWDLPCG